MLFLLENHFLMRGLPKYVKLYTQCINENGTVFLGSKYTDHYFYLICDKFLEVILAF